MSKFFLNEEFSFSIEERKELSLDSSNRKFGQLSNGRNVKEFNRSLPDSNIKISALDFIMSLVEQPNVEKKAIQLPTEGVYVSSGFKRISKKIAKVIDVQEDVVVLEFIIDKNKGKYKTRSYSPNVFDELDLKLNSYLIFNTFKRGSTFKTDISDNQSLISKDELPKYDFDEFSNLF